MNDAVSPTLLAKRRASLSRIDRIAWWLDDAFEIPVIRKRVGIDGIAGIVPFAGDLVGAGLSSLLVIEALRLGAPKRVWMRMGANAGVDFVVGLVPLFGDIFDMAWKANRRNERVLRRWLEQETAAEKKPSRWGGLIGVSLGLAAAFIVTVVLWRALFG
ncbi:hypothetical protein SSPSH_001323 [Salinisphaera shabanensis E1L3A]|jgi:hypothetical protein|uniref:DUF4112 domain-containing protein n=1 Tax=Salinisphaera shabanensis E1L3A TaxID=1033802 RepID=U2FUF1_9GAMM|nr:DUF4112 domain-containing protein [Salinisphaera shabanensis]ERJ19559.1 hypothetical protein SSPSH_001323 [Salinisphaera shabanensis E1L3A]